MKFRYTRHQVARGAMADAVVDGNQFLIKNVMMLRATYQIRLLAYLASTTRKKVVLMLPRDAVYHSSLRDLVAEHPQLFERRELE